MCVEGYVYMKLNSELDFEWDFQKILAKITNVTVAFAFNSYWCLKKSFCHCYSSYEILVFK